VIIYISFEILGYFYGPTKHQSLSWLLSYFKVHYFEIFSFNFQTWHHWRKLRTGFAWELFQHPLDRKGGIWSPQQFLMIWPKSILSNPYSGFIAVLCTLFRTALLTFMKREAEIGSQMPGKTWPSVRCLVSPSLAGNYHLRRHCIISWLQI
jgi:hypothetical protein